MSDRNITKSDLCFTVEWIAKPGEAEALSRIVAEALPLFEKEEGLKAIRIHQSLKDPNRFFFYEIFADQKAYEAHLETAHFKQLILEEAVPRLAHRERLQHKIL